MRRIELVLTLCVALGVGHAVAQNWPSRTIEMIIPFTAGGEVDVIGRAMAAALAEQFGQNRL